MRFVELGPYFGFALFSNSAYLWLARNEGMDPYNSPEITIIVVSISFNAVWRYSYSSRTPVSIDRGPEM